ncbi:MafI family immunity protein [Rathayibacter toxicus]|uniref:MafI family immunity protein n=1 Tax=Rathayibacter toxicus TaxID=145458 RepID=A0A2S5Y6H6_9MICO|nr:MafI family immunity protein [Rathayibacter toxicus]PPH22996.1 hypothetical protein C5D17_06910 [Rathayibacter toxicus]PPH57208.1 hypothetical protein C5D30_06905 [Rathayibacter toxicus]PPH86981.1 hypothetical protein C5D31_06945 [Rathayibacter toxicus]PPI14755.1 hypothetical protein C5C51_06890 [Rathayibacter toxicus]PPI31071.1 hypothetical protein C5D65_06945 [Rathayibacter toxicus]
MSGSTVSPYEADLLQIISNLEDRLSPHEIAEAKDLVKHGEYAVCLEVIVRGLGEVDRPVPADILNKLREEGASWDLGEDICKGLIPE